MRLMGSLILAGIVTACATEPNEGVVTRVSLDRTTVTLEQPVQITVVANAVSRSGAVLRGSSTCLTGFQVRNSAGTVVAPLDQVCTADLVTQDVPYGEPYIKVFSWIPPAESRGGQPALLPGTYRVVGGISASFRELVSESDPVTLEIAAR